MKDFLLLLSVLCFSIVQAQISFDEVEIVQKVFFLGNFDNTTQQQEEFNYFQEEVAKTQESNSVVYLGDYAIDKKNAPNIIQSLFNVEADHLLFAFGDKDWDNTQKNGWKEVNNLQKIIESYGGDVYPENACPGPTVVDIDTVRFIFINSQWFLHDYNKPKSPSPDCKIESQEAFWAELNLILQGSIDKHVILVSHHPVLSSGQYAGKKLWKKHLFPLTDIRKKLFIPLPLIGTFYAAYRQNVGTNRDMADDNYRNYIKHMNNVLDEYSSVIVVSGHEYNLEGNSLDNDYHLNSGAISEFRQFQKVSSSKFTNKSKGFMSLDYMNNGSIYVSIYTIEDGERKVEREVLYLSGCIVYLGENQINFHLPCAAYFDTLTSNFDYKSNSEMVITAGNYKDNKMKNIFMGKHYRSIWNDSVTVPILNLDTAFGGLYPFELGGGRQTTSLKFKANNDQEYVFRSVDKDPMKALSKSLRETVFRYIIQDQTTTQHPYGALIVARLLDSTDILHVNPKLYVLPNDNKLSVFKEDHEGLFGTLEQRPKGKDDIKNGAFHDADVVDKSFKVFNQILESNKVTIDESAFAKARLFDLFIGDWERNEDNWKWVGYKTKDKLIYEPIPLDRDHAFSKWDGVFPWLADREWAKDNVENFDEKLKGLKSLTHQSKNMDRLLLTELSREEWIKQAEYLYQHITDDVIAASLKTLPDDAETSKSEDIERILKVRRTKLIAYANSYYELLAKQVNVIGSNKDEFFELNYNENNTVEVKVYNLVDNERKGRLLYERIFFPNETDEIHLYGLGDNDFFNITGKSKTSILIRIIPGEGADTINDQSSVGGLAGNNKLYKDEEDILIAKNETRSVYTSEKVDFEVNNFQYDTYIPVPAIGFSPDRGFMGGLGIRWINYRLGKPQFHQKHRISVKMSTNKYVRLDYEGTYTDFIRSWDLDLSANYNGPDADNNYYYGLGNTTKIDSELDQKDYYKTDYKKINIQALMVKNFKKKSTLKLGGGYTYVSPFSQNIENTILETIYPDINTDLSDNYFNGVAIVDIDFRDRRSFSKHGARLYTEQNLFFDKENDETTDFYATSLYLLELYQTVKVGIPLTFGVKTGFMRNYGEVPIYESLQLGDHNFLRGFDDNRFSGDKFYFFNSELRFQIGQFGRSVPAIYGIYGLYDVGRTWQTGKVKNNIWHHGYGGGLYFAPIPESLTFNINLVHSVESKVRVNVGLGYLF